MKIYKHFITICSFVAIFLCTLEQTKGNNSILVNKLAFGSELNQLQHSTTSTYDSRKNREGSVSREKIFNIPILKTDEQEKIPNISFVDEANIQYYIKDFSGQVVILYLWASWCLNCVEELVELDKLKERFSYNDVMDIEIVPLTIDFKDIKRIEALYQSKKIENLGLFVDKNKAIMQTFGVNFVPATIVIDKQHRKIAQVNGSIAWDSQEVYDTLIKLR